VGVVVPALIVDALSLPYGALTLPLDISVFSRAVFHFWVGTMPTITATTEPTLF